MLKPIAQPLYSLGLRLGYARGTPTAKDYRTESGATSYFYQRRHFSGILATRSDNIRL